MRQSGYSPVRLIILHQQMAVEIRDDDRVVQDNKEEAIEISSGHWKINL